MEPLYSEEELREEIVKTSRILYERGLITAIGGNISARIPGENAFWITPSQLCKSELKPDDIVKLDLECNQLEGFLKPSIEKLMHARVYKVRPEANAVVHAHNPTTLGLISSGLSLQPVTDEACILLRKPEVIPFIFPGTDKLADAVEAAARKGAKLIILENHGVLGIGYDLLEARAIVELAEDISKIIIISHLLGKEPKPIPEEDIELFKKLYWK